MDGFLVKSQLVFLSLAGEEANCRFHLFQHPGESLANLFNVLFGSVV